jgi:hypothetical protein
MRRAATAFAALAGALLAPIAALAEGGTPMAFAVNRGPGEGLGGAGIGLFACGCAAFVAIVALLVASHLALGRCAASLEAGERTLPEEEAR